LYADAPLLDAHRWRQVDTAAIARNFYEDSFNIFYPQIDWGGRHGYVESEFPIVSALTALIYSVAGPDERFGRFVAIGFSVAAIVAIYALAGELLGQAGGRAAAFLLAISPSAVYYGRTVMPEAPMLFFSIAGLLGFVRYFRTGSSRALVAGASACALAWLAKPVALVIVAPILGVAWNSRGRRFLQDRAFVIAFVSAFALAAAWYLHAMMIYHETGLTFGIGYPTMTYPAIYATGPWYPFSKWSTLELLGSSAFYRKMATQIYFLHLTPLGLGVAAVGWFFWRRNDRRIVPDLWLLGVVAFILAAGKGNSNHDYYQLPLVPVAALYFGAAAAPVFDGAVIRKHVGTGGGAMLSLGALLFAFGLMSFYFSGIVRSHFRPSNLDTRIRDAGTAMERVVPADALMVVVEYGVNSPMLLYYAHRRGWSFDLRSINAETVQNLQHFGARYFAATDWPRLQAQRPELNQYLELHKRVELARAPARVALFDLSRRRE
jgi:4-amino-4-deoxy-L-arabinose transferase-like glycosyltransferase